MREEDVELVKLLHENESVDRQINRMVYELYGLSEEEIRVVEGADEGPDRIKILLQVIQRFEDLLVGSASEPTLQLTLAPEANVGEQSPINIRGDCFVAQIASRNDKQGQIDWLMYELYGLSGEEIRIVGERTMVLRRLVV